MQYSVDSFTIWLAIDNGPATPLVSLEIIIAANAKNTAKVYLPVGNWEINNLPNVINIKRGAKARIDIIYPVGGKFTIFTGIVYDYAPDTRVNDGSLSVAVTLFGQLYSLMTGTLHSSMTVPASFLDSNQYWNTSSKQAGETKRAAIINVDAADEDFGQAFLDSQLELAGGGYAPADSISAAIKSIFGDSINDDAVAVLNSIQPSLEFKDFRNRLATIDGVVLKLNQLLQSDWGVQSFFDRIGGVSNLLLFSLIEDGQAIKMVPFSPAFRNSAARRITSNSYSVISASQDEREPLRNYGGCVLTSSPTVASENNLAVQVAGVFKGPVANQGQVIVIPMPHVFAQATWTTQDTSTAGPRELVNVESDLGNGLAEYFYWLKRFNGRTYNIVSPYLRTDVGLLTPVRVEMPQSNEIASALETTTLYGVVMSISIRLDAGLGSSSTSLEIGYAHTQLDQNEVETSEFAHPLWTTPYPGGNLSGK